MSSFATLPARLTSHWRSPAAPDAQAPTLRAALAASGVTDAGGARCRVNQDAFFTLSTGGALVVGVFDGHGKEAGREAALSARDYCKAHFQALDDFAALERDPHAHFAALFRGCHAAMRSVLTAVFERRGFKVHEKDGYLVKTGNGSGSTDTKQQLQQTTTCLRGGTTATIIVVLDGGRKVLTANVGDSSVAIAVRRRGTPYCSRGILTTTDVRELLHNECDDSSSTAATESRLMETTVATPLILTGDHSPDNRREFIRARAFRCSSADANLPELRFLFDTSDPRGRRKSIFHVSAKGELTQHREGEYLKNVRDEWATLVATPADSAHPDSLAFTRSLGDFHMHTHGVSCEPSVHELSLERVARRALLRRPSRAGNQQSHELSDYMASACITERGDNNSDDNQDADGSEGAALEFMLVAASDGVWDAWKHDELFRLLDAFDAKQQKLRDRKSDAARPESEDESAYPVDGAVAALLKTNLRRAQSIFGDDADNMTVVLCHVLVDVDREIR